MNFPEFMVIAAMEANVAFVNSYAQVVDEYAVKALAKKAWMSAYALWDSMPDEVKSQLPE